MTTQDRYEDWYEYYDMAFRTALVQRVFERLQQEGIDPLSFPTEVIMQACMRACAIVNEFPPDRN